MHKLFIDINVILDVAAVRHPHHEASQKILTLIENKKAVGYLSAVSCPILYYLIRKEIGTGKAADFIRDILRLFIVVEVNRTILEKSLETTAKDFEDGIQMVCAETCRADYIITRDSSDYKKLAIKALSPAEYLATFPPA